MTNEQKSNLEKLEKIHDDLLKIADLFNLAGYECSLEELQKIDQISTLAKACQDLARL